MRTLIVDDEPDMRILMRMLLTVGEACEVIAEATNAADGFREWQRTHPDVVVTDMRMPGESGLDLARRILRVAPHQRIVMCSAYMNQDELDEAREAGVRSCLDKSEIAALPTVVVAVADAA